MRFTDMFAPTGCIHAPPCHPERRKSYGVRFSQSNPTQGRARSGIYSEVLLCSICLAQSNQSLPFKGGGNPSAAKWLTEGVLLTIKILNFIMHAYSFRLTFVRHLPRGGRLSNKCEHCALFRPRSRTTLCIVRSSLHSDFDYA